jgi:CubicO group peptidase (beta-lactamase class C family)
MNYGFTTDVLGFLLARAAGQPLEKFLQERLFGPLGMADTGFWVSAEKRSRFATAYEIHPGTGARRRHDHPDRSSWSAMPGAPSAAAGLVSTADDYLRFARMLLEGGKLDGTRILSRKSIELMTSDFLTPEQRKHPFFMLPEFWAGQGFGLNVAVLDRLGQQAGLGSVGKYGWGGAYGTWWFNDPQEQLIGLLMIQLFNAEAVCKIRPDFENLVYQAIDD